MYEFATAIARGFGLDAGLVVADGTVRSVETTVGPGTGVEGLEPGELLGLDCAGSMGRLGMVARGLDEGISAMRAAESGWG